MARREGFANGPWVTISLVPGELRDIRLELSRGGRVEGVVDASLGAVAGRRVDLFSFRGSSGWANTTTDATGHFTFEAVIPQGYIVELRAHGYGELPSDIDVLTEEQIQKLNREQQPSIRKQVDVREGETTQVTFTASSRQIVVNGIVTAASKPVEGITITCAPVDGDDLGAESISGPDGEFQLTLHQSGGHEFGFYDGHGAFASHDRDIPDAKEVALSFEIPAGMINGRVVDSDGQPIAYMSLTLLRENQAGESADFWDRFSETSTSEEGAFAFTMLVPGSYTMRAPDAAYDQSSSGGVAYGCVVIDGVVVDESTAIDGFRIRLPPEGEILGQVTDPGGSPLTGARLVVLDAKGRNVHARPHIVTDASGSFRISSLGPGDYTMRAEMDNQRAGSAPVGVVAGETVTVTVVVR
jgi:protocatechuate 3,4-dioxygenase beta subunit